MKKVLNAKVYFIIVCWNNEDLLEECFESLYKQTYKDYGIIVVDNNSSDGSVNYIKRNHPDVLLIESPANNAFAIGNNIGIVEALKDQKCEYVALINSDARLDKDWAKELIKFANQHPKGAGFQTPTVDYYDHKILDSYGIKIDRQGRAIQLGHRASVFPAKTQQVFGVHAAAAMYSRSFLDTQPFGNDYLDSDLWMYLEDVDISTRAVVMGWENWYINKSRAYHMGSASSGKNPGFSVHLSYRNNLPMLAKNLPFGLFLRILPGAIRTDFVTLWSLVKSKNYLTLKAILKGRFNGIAMLPKFFGKRKILKKYQGISKNKLWELMK